MRDNSRIKYVMTMQCTEREREKKRFLITYTERSKCTRHVSVARSCGEAQYFVTRTNVYKIRFEVNTLYSFKNKTIDVRRKKKLYGSYNFGSIIVAVSEPFCRVHPRDFLYARRHFV